MGEERQDPKQVALFRALARRMSDAKSDEKFEVALRRLMSPSLDEAGAVIGSGPISLPKKRAEA